MIMSLQIPSSPSDGASISSTHPPSPFTPPPISHSLSDVNADSNSTTIPPASAGKRKPSRRANTAERRATHNAVERQRRETLNGRFLDLAGLLPNLSQIRRPSKSAIVNSSIAHIHASRRHRLIAARELRMLKAETDALRQQLNEWHDRSGLPRVEEPTRSDSFNLVFSGEAEFVAPSQQEDMEDDGDDDLHPRSPDEVEEVVHAAAVKRSQSPITAPSPTNQQFTHNAPSLPIYQNSVIQVHPQQVGGGPQTHQTLSRFVQGRQHPHTHIANSGPMIATHQPPVSYENPAMMYDGYAPSQLGYNVPQPYVDEQLPSHFLAQLGPEMEQKVGPGWYHNTTGQFTPPSSSGGSSPVGSPFGFPTTQQPRYMENIVVERERSTSIGDRGSPVGNYGLVHSAHIDTVPRWGNGGLGGAPQPNPAGYPLLV